MTCPRRRRLAAILFAAFAAATAQGATPAQLLYGKSSRRRAVHSTSDPPTAGKMPPRPRIVRLPLPVPTSHRTP